MLGVYDYTVILTYISLWISIGGMMLSLNGHLDLAVLCLALSGLCDMFDGKIARTKNDRTESVIRDCRSHPCRSHYRFLLCFAHFCTVISELHCMRWFFL